MNQIARRLNRNYEKLQYKLGKVCADLNRVQLVLEAKNKNVLNSQSSELQAINISMNEANQKLIKLRENQEKFNSKDKKILRINYCVALFHFILGYIMNALREEIFHKKSETGRRNSFHQFEKVDQLHEEDKGQECYAILKPSSGVNFVENFLFFAHQRYFESMLLDPENPKKKEIIAEGQKYAVKAYEIEPDNFLVLKWAAVLTEQLLDYLDAKEKIETGYHFKNYLDKALSIKPDYSLYHMRGRFAFLLSSEPWLKWAIVSIFYATPPTATFDEALADFLEVEKLRPAQWIENLWYIGRTYIEMKKYDKAVEYLKQAISIVPGDDSEKKALEASQALLKKYSK